LPSPLVSFFIGMLRKSAFTLIEVLVTMTVLSIGALAIMKYASQSQDMMADIVHIDTLSRLAGVELRELEKDGFSASLSREGSFDDYPGYSWAAKTHLLMSGGWYRLVLVVRRDDTGRTVTVERIFREVL
jgi:prepilin-type N-terminal cleavage/methylation domain-containing protein